MSRQMRKIPNAQLVHHPDALQRALELVAERTVEEGECLIWQGSHSNKTPTACIAGTARSLRPLLWMATRGRAVQSGRLVSMSCNVPGCVAPDHLWLTTRSAIVKRAAATNNGVSRSAKCAAVARQRAPKLTMAKARDIRKRRHERADSLAAEYNVHESLIRRIWRNQAWAEHAANSSVFAWRPAA